MYAIDFEYDGQYLSDYGFIICDFESSSGTVVANAGSTISFNKVSRHNGMLYSLSHVSYDECIQTTFDICKDPDKFEEYEERMISNDECRDLMRWLNRKEFLKFQVFDYENERDTCYFNVSFNVEKIKIAEKLVGLRLTMESDRPFGYGQEITTEWTFSEANSYKVLSDMSDEIGYIYPDLTIKINQSGDLSIYNELLNCTMTINNCMVGEIITILGNEQIISTTYVSHDIANDFNYEFFKIGNTINNRNNRISSNLPCKLTIKYTPIIKDTP